jgi:hypothetical protein
MNRANTILEIKESLKKLFSTSEVKFAEIELMDGTKIVCDSDKLDVGVNVFGLDDQGNQIALDNGDLVLADGRTLTIENGAIKAIIEAAHTEESPVSEGEIEAAEVVVEEKAAREITVDVTEDVAALTNGENLSEEFKAKAATIFEAAVITRVKTEVTKLQEEFDNQLAEQVEEIKEGLVEKVDGYLNYVVEQWIAQNEIALESGMKSEILESFVDGMKGLFAEHYIEVPEEKFDVLGDMQEKLEQLETKLDETVASNVNLTKQINEQKRIAAVSEAADGLADTDAEKFKGLAEELIYEDADSFKKKLQTIRENYFTNKSTSLIESVVTDSPVITEEFKAVDPSMKSYLSVLNSIKK